MADKVILVRHGIAEMRTSIVSDDQRKLTARGKELLLEHYPTVFPSLLEGASADSISIMASSAVRTMQTAEIICDVLGVPRSRIFKSHALTVQDEYRAEDEIRAMEGTVIAVGHSPSLDELASRMSGRMRMMMRGEALCLDMTKNRGRTGTVEWDCRPR